MCIVGDVVYGIGESVPSEQPCLKCTCSAPGVDCETMTCHQPPGCRAIHRPNKCCPDYQCGRYFGGAWKGGIGGVFGDFYRPGYRRTKNKYESLLENPSTFVKIGDISEKSGDIGKVVRSKNVCEEIS